MSDRAVQHAAVVAAALLGGPAIAQTACPTFVAQASSPVIEPGGTRTITLGVLSGVHMATNEGAIDVNLMLDSAPNTSANFLAYVRHGRYDGVVFHRSVPLSVQTQIGVIQGGGYRAPTQAVAQMPTEQQPLTAAQRPAAVETFPPIALEHPVGNVRGTLAMARFAVPNSATSQFFINTADNNADVPGERFSLDAVAGQPGRDGYAVFGTVTPASLAVVDAIRDRAVIDVSYIIDDFAFNTVPLRRPYEDELTFPLLPSQYVTIASATATATPAASWPQGAGLTYRWQQSGAPIFDDERHSGTGTPVLTISGTSIIDTASYFCEVSGLACTGGTVTSESVELYCPADLGAAGATEVRDALLNNNDFIVFITYFFARDARADFGSTGGVRGPDGEFNNNDFIAYIDAFFDGC